LKVAIKNPADGGIFIGRAYREFLKLFYLRASSGTYYSVLDCSIFKSLVYRQRHRIVVPAEAGTQSIVNPVGR
jgi:hypothetical protein